VMMGLIFVVNHLLIVMHALNTSAHPQDYGTQLISIHFTPYLVIQLLMYAAQA